MNIDNLLSSAQWHRYERAARDEEGAVNDDHRAVLAVLGAGEGFIGNEFVRLYRPRDLEHLNRSYEVSTYLPNLFIIGGNGCGEAYAYDLANSPVIVKVPFVPLDSEYVAVAAPSLGELLLSFAVSPPAYAPNPETFEKEIDQIQPICLGGSATDPANQATLTREKHIELVTFWNKTFRTVKRKTLGDA